MIQRTPPFALSIEDAQALGVHAGTVDETPLEAWQRDDPWCTPLVITGAVEVFDFTAGYDPHRELKTPFGIGRYDEDRRNMYNSDLFKADAESRRTIHMGIDIGAVEGTPIFAPVSAKVWGVEINRAEGDYGGTIILKATRGNRNLYILFGHLSHASTRHLMVGDELNKGDLIGWLGAKAENGGWNPHLHWQISRLEPRRVDLPGAVTPALRQVARRIFPDPTDMLKLALAGWRG